MVFTHRALALQAEVVKGLGPDAQPTTYFLDAAYTTVKDGEEGAQFLTTYQDRDEKFSAKIVMKNSLPIFSDYNSP